MTPTFTAEMQPVDYDGPDTGVAFYHKSGTQLPTGSTDSFTVEVTGAGAVAGNTYSLSVIADIDDFAGGSVQETLTTVTGTFSGSAPMTITVPSFSEPTTFTNWDMVSSSGNYHWGAELTLTTPNDNLTSTAECTLDSTLTEALLVWGPEVSNFQVDGAAAGSTISTGDVITFNWTAGGAQTNAVGNAGLETNAVVSIGTGSFTSTSNLSNTASVNGASFTVGSITAGTDYLFEIRSRKNGNTDAYITVFSHQFTGA